ncbi:MAG: aldo/keto reductase [Deltaproteobacteria bacterium]|nr:aldo/keto reductase [Deltaproteobacteria bacterium]
MEYRFLGQTGVRVSSLGFGTMSFGGDVDRSTSAKLFARCRDRGINLFDCADVYAGGKSEETLGKLIKGCRDEVVLASKAYFPTSDDVNARGSSRYHLVHAVEASLKRLKTDHLDIYFLHRFDDVTAVEGALRALQDLVTQGKILYPALSNAAAWQTVKALEIAKRHGWEPLCCVQPMYNLVKRQAEVEILPMAVAEGMGVMPYSPTGAGLLTGKYGERKRPDGGRLVDNAMYKTRYAEASYYKVAARFTELARGRNLSPAALAIAWVASHPAVTAPLIGARNLEQLDECLEALDIDLDHGLRESISALSPTPPPATDRNEESSEHNFGSR